MSLAHITKILHVEQFEDRVRVIVQLDAGDEPYEIWVGGSVETFHHKGKNRAWVKKVKNA